MVKIVSNSGDVQVSLEGSDGHVLADLTIGTARCLVMILEGEPKELRDDLMRRFFENILFSMNVMESEDEEQ